MPKRIRRYLLFARRQCRQDFSCLLLKVDVHHRVRGRNDPFVFDKIAEMAVFLFPTGVSSEIGSLAILRTFRTLSKGISILLAISSGVGSRPIS